MAEPIELTLLDELFGTPESKDDYQDDIDQQEALIRGDG